VACLCSPTITVQGQDSKQQNILHNISYRCNRCRLDSNSKLGFGHSQDMETKNGGCSNLHLQATYSYPLCQFTSQMIIGKKYFQATKVDLVK